MEKKRKPAPEPTNRRQILTLTTFVAAASLGSVAAAQHFNLPTPYSVTMLAIGGVGAALHLLVRIRIITPKETNKADATGQLIQFPWLYLTGRKKNKP